MTIDDIYDLPAGVFARRIGLRLERDHCTVESLLEPAVGAYWRKRLDAPRNREMANT